MISCIISTMLIMAKNPQLMADGFSLIIKQGSMV
jgi:hypothetical protein